MTATRGIADLRRSTLRRRSLRRAATRSLAAAGLAVAGLVGAAVTGSLTALPADAATPVPDLCTAFPHPAMPPSTGTETPAGFTVQMPGAVLAPAGDAATLAQAYSEWNDMTCTEYTHHYRFAPPKYYYTDCVGFTGYTTSKADTVAWHSVATTLHIAPGYVPTPLHFEEFFNGLAQTPQAGWQAVADVSAIRPGDVLAWQPATDGQPDLTGVGHSVMPLVAPQPIAGSHGTRWEVVIMDSTAGGHGPDDTRRPDDPLSERNAPILTASGQVQPSGLGIGTIALDTTPAGAVTGVEWNVGDAPESIIFGAGHPLDDPSPTPPTPGPQPVPSGYDVAAADGVVSSSGAAYNYGPTTALTLAAPVVGLATTTDGNGYWEAAADGGVFAFGTAPFRGSMGGRPLTAPAVGIAGAPDQDGYWLVGADGGVFAFGDAGFYGSLGGTRLNAPIVGIAATQDGKGYWLVGADGGVFAYGDAVFEGSMGGAHLNAPVVGMASTPDGTGYWLVGADGGVFAFGDATFEGAMAGRYLDAPVVAVGATADGGGYWEFAADGGVFAFGDATFAGAVTPGTAAIVSGASA
jgi:hypothetical protein